MATSVFTGGTSNFGPAGPRLGLRDTQVSLQAQFKDFSQNNIDVQNPTVTLRREGQIVSVVTLGFQPNDAGGYNLNSPLIGLPGRYKFDFLTNNLQAGYYNVEFGGKWTDVDGVEHTLTVPGAIGLGEIARVQDIINRVIIRLMDDHPEDYRLDEPVHQWEQGQIYSYIRDAIDRINLTGLMITNYEVDTIPSDELVVTGAVIFALLARARFEKANEMDYSDVHTLNIKRADFYKQLADSMMKDWLDLIISWKRARPPKPIGLRSQTVPWRITRVLGMLPNMSNIFSN